MSSQPNSFQWTEGGEYLAGTGTIEQYFGYTQPDIVQDILKDPKFAAAMSSYEERDKNLSQLQTQLFTEFSGLKRTDVIHAFDPESQDALDEALKTEGLVMILWQPDDPIFALYKDGKPIAAYYVSFRGIYQAGGYVVEGDRHFYAHNFRQETPKNKWLEEGKDFDGHDICSEIARDFLLRTPHRPSRVFQPERSASRQHAGIH